MPTHSLPPSPFWKFTFAKSPSGCVTRMKTLFVEYSSTSSAAVDLGGRPMALDLSGSANERDGGGRKIEERTVFKL